MDYSVTHILAVKTGSCLQTANSKTVTSASLSQNLTVISCSSVPNTDLLNPYTTVTVVFF